MDYCFHGLVNSAAAAKLGVPSPTPWEDLPGNGYQTNGGVNFGVGGAAVTYAYGWKPLEKQVDEFEALVKGGTWTGDHLAQSVALVSIGVNDYTYYNQYGNVVQVGFPLHKYCNCRRDLKYRHTLIGKVPCFVNR